MRQKARIYPVDSGSLGRTRTIPEGTIHCRRFSSATELYLDDTYHTLLLLDGFAKDVNLLEERLCLFDPGFALEDVDLAHVARLVHGWYKRCCVEEWVT